MDYAKQEDLRYTMDYIIWMIIAIAAIASSLKGKQHRDEWDVALN
jgi:hypothetical protein